MKLRVQVILSSSSYFISKQINGKNINTTQASQKIQGSSKLAAYCR